MASFTLNIGFFLTLTIVAALGRVEGDDRKEEYLCLPVQYVKLDLKDKPDLLVIERIERQHDPSEHGVIKIVMCRIERDRLEIRGTPIREAVEDDVFGRDIEYDTRTQMIYRDTFNGIKKIYIRTGEENEVYEYEYDPRSPILSIAYDWVTKNLYHYKGNEIRVLNVWDDTKDPQTIISGLKDKQDVKIKVLPNQGYIILQNRNSIMRYNLDGTGITSLYNRRDVKIYDVAVDYYENRVYWVEQNKQDRQEVIRNVDISGADQAVTLRINDSDSPDSYDTTGVVKKLRGFIQHIQVDKKYVYFKTGESFRGHFLRVLKSNGSLDEVFDVTEHGAPYAWKGKFLSVNVLSSNPQVIAEDHPCKNDNGGCDDGYCLAVPEGPTQKLVKKCIATEVHEFKRVWNKVKEVVSSIFD